MGVSLSIKFSQAYAFLEELNSISGNVDSIKDRVELVQREVQAQGSLKHYGYAIGNVIDQLNLEIRNIRNRESVLRKAIKDYETVEKKLAESSDLKRRENEEDTGSSQGSGDVSDVGNKYWQDKSWFQEFLAWIGWGEPFTEEQIDSIVYDDEGTYGGDQGSPRWEWGSWSEKADLYEIVRNYYPDMTDKEIKDYLNKLNSEGCGYVALVNTIFAEYEGREDEFERDFGFPMYYNGDLNYDKLLVDIYAATDNHNLDENGNDVIDVNEDENATTGAGTDPYERRYRLNKYFEDKNAGISMETTIYDQNDITVDNFMEYAEEGHIIISYFYGNLQNEDGSVAQPINGGHGMVVTGVTSDGRFIVSSWGEKYYIDPSEIITLTDSDNVVHTTNFFFEVLKYEEGGE